jgi:hypothetical protein
MKLRLGSFSHRLSGISRGGLNGQAFGLKMKNDTCYSLYSMLSRRINVKVESICP